MESGLTTLGVRLAYAVETTAGQKPANSGSGSSISYAFTELSRINAIGGAALDVENIDTSALIDKITRYKPGRADTGGSFPVTVNITNDTITEWNNCISAYQNRGTGLRMWFQIWHPELSKAFFIVAAPPSSIPMPETNQNENWTVEMNLTIEEFKGADTPVPFAHTEGDSSAA